MDSKLIEAIVLRIKAGHTKEQIQSEFASVGHDTADFLLAYAAAEASLSKELVAEVTPVAEMEVPLAPSSTLPAYSSLFKQSWALMRGNIKLLIKSILAMIAIFILSGVGVVLLVSFAPVSTPAGYLLKFAAFVTLALLFTIFSISCFASVLRGLLKRQEGLRYTTHFTWVLLNIVGITMVSLYTNILTQVGYAIFFVPGIMLSVYLIFAIFLQVSGESKGLSTLTLSTTMIYGRFWGVLLRVLAGALALVALLAVSIPLASLSVLINPFFVPTFVVFVLAVVLLGAYFQLCFTVVLFESVRSLSPAKPLPFQAKNITKLYKVIIGVVLVAMLIGLVFFAFMIGKVFEQNSRGNTLSSTEIMLDVADKHFLKLATEEAVRYFETNGTFTDVCASLALVDKASCTSTESTYSLEVPLSWGFYCVDSTGYNEVVRSSALEEGKCTTSDLGEDQKY